MQKQYLSLHAAEVLTRLLSMVVLLIILILVGSMVLLFGSFAVAYWLGELLDSTLLGFAVIACLLLVMSLLVYLASGLVSPFWGLATLLWAYLLNLSRTLRMKEVKTVFGLAALPFIVIMSINIAVKVFNWRPIAVATPVFLAALFLSYLAVGSYEKKH